MLDDLSRAMQAADERVQDWQKAIKKGDCFLFFRHSAERDWEETEYGFRIYGEVLEDAYCEEYLKNYRFCNCHSSACPEGELGDVHLSVIGGLIAREEFKEKIQALQWSDE